eukprot:CFRG7746T1
MMDVETTVAIIAVFCVTYLFIYNARTKAQEASMKYGPETERCQPLDYIEVLLDSRKNMCIINGAIVVRNALLGDVQAAVKKVLLDPWYKRLTKCLVLFKNVPFWVTSKGFRLEDHVYKALEEGNSKPMNDIELMEWIAAELVQNLPLDKPLWKIIVMENFRQCDDGSGDMLSCIVMRVHHVVADGVSLASMLNTMMTTQAELDLAKQGAPLPKRSHMVSVTNKVHQHPWVLAFYTAICILPTMARILFAKTDVNPFKTKTLTGKKYVGMLKTPIDMHTLKEVKNKIGMTVNDILMGLMGCALNRTWEKIDANNKVTSVKVAMPVNMRAGTTRATFDNHTAALVIDIPTNSSDPLTSCRSVKTVLDHLKTYPAAQVCMHSMVLLAYCLPYPWTEWILKYFSSKTTGVVSNVPGPTEDMYFMDKHVERIGVWVPQVGTSSLGLTMVSIGNKLNIGCVLDSGASDKAQMFCDEYYRAFKDLERSVLE